MARTRSWLAAFLAIVIAGPSPAFAAAFPAYMNYQGKLGDAAGNPLTGTYSFRFRIYDRAVGGNLLATDANYNGANAVAVTNGLYSVQIGSLTAGGLPEQAFLWPEAWLEIDVNAGVNYTGAETLAPRERLAAVPYAFRAVNAEKLGTGVAVATFTATGNLTLPYGLTAATASFTNTSGFSLLVSSGISVAAGGVYAPFFSGAHYGDGSQLTGLTATSVSPSGVDLSTVTAALALKANLAGATFTGASGITNQAFTATGPNGNIVSGASVAASGFFGNGAGLTGVTVAPSGVDLSTVTAALALKANLAGATFTGASGITNAAFTATGPNGNIASASSVTASAFFGDGSQLTGITGGLDRVLKIGDAMTGPLSMLAGSTITVSGNAFSVGGSSFVVTGGSVSIGSLVPATKLDVAGDAQFGAGATKSTFTAIGSLFLASGSSLTLAGSAGNFLSRSSVTASAFFGDGSNLTGIAGGTDRVLKAGDTMTGALVMSGPTANITSGSSVTASAFFGDGSGLTNVGGAADKVAKAGDTMTGTLTLSPAAGAALVTTAGGVGIGATPVAKLDVAGGSIRGLSQAIITQPGSGKGIELYYDGGNDRARIQSVDRDAPISKPLLLDGSIVTMNLLSGGNVGVATAVPGAKFEVAGGNIRALSQGTVVSPTTGTGLELYYDGLNGRGRVQSVDRDAPAPRPLYLDGSVTVVNLFSGGDVGVNIAVPAAKLDVEGTAKFGTGTTKATFGTAGQLTQTGPNGYITNASSVNASGFFGNGAGITGVTAANVAAANVTAGTFLSGVGILPSGVDLSTVTAALALKANLAGATFTGASGITNAAFTATGANGHIISGSSVNASAFFASGSSFRPNALATPTDSCLVAGNNNSVSSCGNSNAFGGYNSVTQNNAGAFGLSNTASAFAAFAFGSGVTNSVSNSVMIGHGNTGKITLLSGGNVGVGTTAPAATLDVEGSAQFGAGATKSTFTAGGDLTTASNADITMTGPAAYFTSGSSVTASGFFGSGAGLTGVTATTNANLTGAVTSVGNATTIVGPVPQSGVNLSTVTTALGTKQDLDADLTDLADGTLTGSKVGTGIVAANIAAGTFVSGVGILPSGVDLSTVTTALAGKQDLDADLTDLADGTLTGSKVGTGIVAANIAAGTADISITGNAATVTTNANLTGNVTSVGNATTLASIPAISGANLTNLTGANVTGTVANANITRYVSSPDGDRVNHIAPNALVRNLQLDFKNATAVGGTGNYAGVLTYSPWDGTTASTGDPSYQLAFYSNAANGTLPRLRIRNGIDVGWNSWYDIWNASSDGAGSGLDADLLDGIELHAGTNNEANKVVRTDVNGYIQAGWINSISGDNGTTAITRVTASSDAYLRYYTLPNFASQIRALATVASVAGDYPVAQILRWKNYGNSHVIFDASAGTSPSGSAVSNSVPDVAWSATYPTLMGWNGTNTYGVRVYQAQVATYAP